MLNGAWRSLARGWFTPVFWREAALCGPGPILILTVGYAIGQPVAAVVAAGTAMSVGFGAARTLRHSRFAAMIWTILTTAVAAIAGSLAANEMWIYLPLCALASGAVAALSVRDQEIWWVALQAVIAFFVAGYFPGDVDAAFLRAQVIAIGGVCQIVMVVLLAKVFPAVAIPLPAQDAMAPPSRAEFDVVVIRAAICAPLALVVANAIGLHNSYWAPTTALVVLKPGLMDTQWRGLARISGTLAGCLCASSLAIAFTDSPIVLIPAIGIAASAAFALQRAQYGVMTFAQTCAIVMLLDLGQGHPEANARHRIAATLLGGALAVVIAYIGPHDRTKVAMAKDRIAAQRGLPPGSGR